MGDQSRVMTLLYQQLAVIHAVSFTHQLLIEDSTEHEGVFGLLSADGCPHGLHVERYV